MFIDVDEGADVSALRDVPHAHLVAAHRVLLRTTADEGDVEELLRRLGLAVPAGILDQQVGKRPAAIWLTTGAVARAETKKEQKKRRKAKKRAEASTEDELLDRARRIELRALLDWGGAVWRAGKHHYLLPSGLHANAFVKAGHAIGEPRDAEVLASWLLDRFDPETPTSMVVDTGTLSAITLALKAHPNARLGDVAILERYPATDVDLERVLDSISRTGRIAALISVCSSGAIRDRLFNVFRHQGQRNLTWSIDSLVDLKEAQPEQGQIRSWVVLPRDDKAIVVESHAGDCKLCRDHERAILVPIDPHTFDAYIPTLQERAMPDVSDGDRNQRVWEACTRTGGIQLEATPDEHVRAARRTGEILSVKIDFSTIIDQEFVQSAHEELQKRIKAHPELLHTDLVLVPEPDVARSGFSRIWSVVSDVIRANRATLPSAGTWSDDLKGLVRGAKRILVFTLGSVTGGSMQRALTGMQHCRQGFGADYTITGLVLHARPESSREWATLENSYERRLYYLWRTYLPSYSPLREESELLERVDVEDASEAAQQFWATRRSVCQGRVPRPETLFWGANAAIRLTAHSRFGHALDQIATYTAVASALQSKRQDRITLPHRRSFELPAVFRSFYDPLIVCSVLRWIRPYEAWWGHSPNAAESVAFDLLERARDDAAVQSMIAAELLVASALGKLPATAAKAAVEERAKRLLDAEPARAFLEIALRLPRERARPT